MRNESASFVFPVSLQDVLGMQWKVYERGTFLVIMVYKTVRIGSRDGAAHTKLLLSTPSLPRT